MRTSSFKVFALSIALLTGLIGATPRADAAIDNAFVSVIYNGITYRSTTVLTASSISSTGTGISYIDVIFRETGGQQITLRIDSSSQARIDAFFNQLVTSINKNTMRITAYANQQVNPTLFRATLETATVYFLLGSTG
jgi:hypothetical protein